MKLASVEALVRERMGLDPASLGPNILTRLVAARMHARQMTAADAYAGLLATDPQEWATLQAELLVPETWFFRGGRALFDHLAALVRTRAMAKPVRILSVPCCTGEEPYSLVMALDDQGVPPSAYGIDAVDLSAEHLARAAAGVYSAFAFREVGSDPRPRCFQKKPDGRWELLAPYREPVRFRIGNVIDPEFLAGEPPYDLILCRNLFIYLTVKARTLAIANLDRLLAADGRLCLTPAEADRLPGERFTPDGPPALATFRRNTGTKREPRSGTIATTASRRTPPPIARPKREPTPAIEPRPPAAPTLADARSLADAGRLDEARKLCEQLLNNGPPPADLFALLGVIHLAAGRRADAANVLRKALYLEPDHAEALTHMIVVHEQRGERDQAAALRRRLDRRERA